MDCRTGCLCRCKTVLLRLMQTISPALDGTYPGTVVLDLEWRTGSPGCPGTVTTVYPPLASIYPFHPSIHSFVWLVWLVWLAPMQYLHTTSTFTLQLPTDIRTYLTQASRHYRYACG